jgi:hypothetical protein
MSATVKCIDSLPMLLLLLILLLPCRYTRANVNPPNSINITINGGNYRNINPIDKATADKVWGQYSQRYAYICMLSGKVDKPFVSWIVQRIMH